jgi:hypothetical protein
MKVKADTVAFYREAMEMKSSLGTKKGTLQRLLRTHQPIFALKILSRIVW